MGGGWKDGGEGSKRGEGQHTASHDSRLVGGRYSAARRRERVSILRSKRLLAMVRGCQRGNQRRETKREESGEVHDDFCKQTI